MSVEVNNLSECKFFPNWLELKLSDTYTTFLWDCIKNRKKETYKSLAGNLYGSHELDNAEDKKNFYEKIINPLVMTWINEYGNEIFYDQLRGFCTKEQKMQPFLNDWWVNFQHEGDFNPIHDHGGLFSFVIWMQIPTDWKQQKQLPRCIDSTCETVSNFQFLYVSPMGKILNHTYFMSPEMEGTMLFFPASLKHTVYPFYDCKKERISISGNVSVNPF